MIRHLALLGLSLLSGASEHGGKQKADRPSLLVLVSELDAAGPLDRQKLERIAGIAVPCGDAGCGATGLRLADVEIGRITLYDQPRGTMVIFEDLHGGCVAGEDFARRFKLGPPESNCTDGVICIYRAAERRWGRLSIGLPEDENAPQCIRSVILDAPSLNPLPASLNPPIAVRKS